ncbi:MAG: T9SS type A sorting domain-containing protein, partial [Bacteroidales bacterium]
MMKLSLFQADEYESNDTRDESATIDLSTDIEGTIFPEDDVDFYEFQTENTDEWDRIEFDVSDVSEDLEIQITVYDADGEEVFSDNTSTPGSSLTSTMETKGGTYYVEVKDRWEEGSES